MKLLIIGAGGYGRLVKEIALSAGFTEADFLDDNSPLSIGRITELERLEAQYDGSIVAIGNPTVRARIFGRLQKPVNVLHPTAVISKSAQLGRGCVVEAHTVINSEAAMGDGVFVCAGAVINHNASVEAFCQIDCNAVVAAGAAVPKGMKVASCTVFCANPSIP